jgi:hypothetical protein
VAILLRPLTREDVPAWNRLLADIERVDATGEQWLASCCSTA